MFHGDGQAPFLQKVHYVHLGLCPARSQQHLEGILTWFHPSALPFPLHIPGSPGIEVHFQGLGVFDSVSFLLAVSCSSPLFEPLLSSHINSYIWNQRSCVIIANIWWTIVSIETGRISFLVDSFHLRWWFLCISLWSLIVCWFIEEE